MTKRTDDTPETPAAPAKRQREITAAPTSGGKYGEDGTLLEGAKPEPDDHRMKKPER